jgi:hypothetical protein
MDGGDYESVSLCGEIFPLVESYLSLPQSGGPGQA